MSADNGIYILVNPECKDGIFTGKNEYRVAMCSAIDNIETGYLCEVKDDEGNVYKLWALYEVLMFASSAVYDVKLVALSQASNIEEKVLKEGGYIEYGIRTLYRDHPFPDISVEKAKVLRDKYYSEREIRRRFK